MQKQLKNCIKYLDAAIFTYIVLFIHLIPTDRRHPLYIMLFLKQSWFGRHKHGFNWVQWHTSTVPAIQEAGAEDPRSGAKLGTITSL